MLERIGVRETKNEDFKKLAYKYTAINRTDNQHINVLASIHSIGLQRSDYIQIDNKLIFDMHKNPGKLHVKESDELIKLKANNDLEEKDPVYIRYVGRKEVDNKRHMFLVHKALFQANKIDGLLDNEIIWSGTLF